MRQTCVVTDSRGYAHVTAGDSLFEAVANAIEWWEVDCVLFGTARRVGDDEIMSVHVVAGGKYRVRVGRVREWLAKRAVGR